MDKKNPEPNGDKTKMSAMSEITKAFSKAPKATDKNKKVWYEGAD
ncbi:MAG: hypothetical protein AB7W16_18310 [Candidatus Obscuribacterales bacterium]